MWIAQDTFCLYMKCEMFFHVLHFPHMGLTDPTQTILRPPSAVTRSFPMFLNNKSIFWFWDQWRQQTIKHGMRVWPKLMNVMHRSCFVQMQTEWGKEKEKRRKRLSNQPWEGSDVTSKHEASLSEKPSTQIVPWCKTYLYLFSSTEFWHFSWRLCWNW